MDHERMAAVVPALQLLLADASPSVQRQVFITAFPDNYLVLRGEADKLSEKLSSIRSKAEEIRGICGGSSPLGVLAAKRASEVADLLRNEARVLSGMIGLVT